MHALRAAPDLFRVGFAGVVAYRAEMVIWILSALLPLVMLALWNAVVADGSIAGFGAPEIARYFAATLVVRQLTGAWVFWTLEWEIRSGTLSAKLLRPLNPLWFWGVEMLAAMPLRLAVLAPVVVALALWRPDILTLPHWTALALFVPSVLLAWFLSFAFQALFGLLTFWLDRASGLFGLWFGVWALFSGYLAPLALYPEQAERVLRWLPFQSMLAVPVELLGGFTTAREALDDVTIQLGWSVVLLGLLVFTWRRGVRRYGAFGS